MGVIVEESGRRSVQVEVGVPGTVEEAWRAIATAEGILSWFVPAEFAMDDDGQPERIRFNFGPGMASESKVTAWEPPHSFRSVSSDFVEEGAPVTTEWQVEAAAGGGCVVRVEHSLFTDSEERDAHLLGVEEGWPGFFRILQIYMTDFRGQPCSTLEYSATAAGDAPAWERLGSGLGFAGGEAGELRGGAGGRAAVCGQARPQIRRHRGNHAVRGADVGRGSPVRDAGGRDSNHFGAAVSLR